jgi:hypothetical protein
MAQLVVRARSSATLRGFLLTGEAGTGGRV